MTERQHLDAATLGMLQDVLEDGFAGLLETFIADSAAKIERLREGLAKGDSDLVRRSAHSLKGSSGNLGANIMADLCLRLEEQARDEDLRGLHSVLEQLEAEFELVQGIMQHTLQSL
jgi:HPt (histidine-containing phosphotransfer) domain-containing protein